MLELAAKVVNGLQGRHQQVVRVAMLAHLRPSAARLQLTFWPDGAYSS
jgi:hypothetical protein